MKEFRRFRYFYVAAKSGSFRRAAKALHVQESTLSRAIRDLEDELGASLFSRHSGGVELTFAGEIFLERTLLILQQICQTAQDVSDIGSCVHGRIHIGIFSSLASEGFLSELLTIFRKDHTGVLIKLSDGQPVDYVSAVRRFGVDVCFVAGIRDWQECEAETLWHERLFVALPEGHKITSLQIVKWADLANETFIVCEESPGPEIREFISRRITSTGHTPRIETYTLALHNLLSLVALKHGLTLVSESRTALVLPGIVYRPIVGELLPFSAVWLRQNDNPTLRRLLTTARKMSVNPAF